MQKHPRHETSFCCESAEQRAKLESISPLLRIPSGPANQIHQMRIQWEPCGKLEPPNRSPCFVLSPTCAKLMPSTSFMRAWRTAEGLRACLKRLGRREKWIKTEHLWLCRARELMDRPGSPKLTKQNHAPVGWTKFSKQSSHPGLGPKCENLKVLDSLYIHIT